MVERAETPESGYRDILQGKHVGTAAAAQPFQPDNKPDQDCAGMGLSAVSERRVCLDIYTGTSENKRPEFNRMLDDVKAGRIKIVVVKSIQRFGRNTVTVMSAINDIRHAGGYVYFEVENLDTKTAANDNIITIMGGVAQEESYFKSKNIKFGIRESLKEPEFTFIQQVLLRVLEL